MITRDNEPADEELLVRISGRDHEAFATLVRRHTEHFYRLAARITGSPTEAEEVVQEAFLTIWRNPRAWDPGRGSRFSTWLYRVVVNRALKSRRHVDPVNYLEFSEVQSEERSQQELLEQREEQLALERALLKLPPRQRAALMLCFYEGLSNQEAADALGVRLKALQSLIVRGKAKLRTALSAHRRRAQ